MFTNAETEDRWAGRMIIAVAAVGIAVMVKREVVPYIVKARWARADKLKHQQQVREAAERASTVHDFGEYDEGSTFWKRLEQANQQAFEAQAAEHLDNSEEN